MSQRKVREEMMCGESAKHVGNWWTWWSTLSVPFKESLVTSTAGELPAAFIYQPLQSVPQLKRGTLFKVKEKLTSDDWSRQGYKGSVILDKLGTTLAVHLAPSGVSWGCPGSCTAAQLLPAVLASSFPSLLQVLILQVHSRVSILHSKENRKEGRKSGRKPERKGRRRREGKREGREGGKIGRRENRKKWKKEWMVGKREWRKEREKGGGKEWGRDCIKERKEGRREGMKEGKKEEGKEVGRKVKKGFSSEPSNKLNTYKWILLHMTSKNNISAHMHANICKEKENRLEKCIPHC